MTTISNKMFSWRYKLKTFDSIAKDKNIPYAPGYKSKGVNLFVDWVLGSLRPSLDLLKKTTAYYVLNVY